MTSFQAFEEFHNPAMNIEYQADILSYEDCQKLSS